MKIKDIRVGHDYAVSRGGGRPRRARVVGFEKRPTGGYGDRSVTKTIVNFVKDDGTFQLTDDGSPYVAAYESRDVLHTWTYEEARLAEVAENERRYRHTRALHEWATNLVMASGFPVDREQAFGNILALRFKNLDELLHLAEFVAKHSGVEIPPRPIKEGTTP